jgi:hypothetical protein
MSLIVMLAITGCSEDDDPVNSTSTTGTTAKIRVIHTSYDAPAVDVRVDGAVAISGLSYGQSSGYAEVQSGTRKIEVTPANAATPVVISVDLPVEAGKEYTVYAVNQLSAIEAVVSEDNRSVTSTKAKVRFLHSSPDAPAVDIKLNSGSGTTVFGNQSFKDISDYTEVDAGSYTFVVTPANSTSEVLVFKPISVQNGQVYTVIAHGTLDNMDNVDFATRVFIDSDAGVSFADLEAATSEILVVHTSPDAPGVDLLVDNIVLNTQPLTFPNNTGYISLNAGSRNIKVNASGTTTSVIDATPTFEANKNYSIFAADVLANITPVVFEDDLTAPAAGNSHVRFIHLSPDAPPVDITLTDGTVVFGNISFKQSTDMTPLPAGAYDLQVRAAGTTNVVLSLPTINLADGKIYTVFAKGNLSGGSQPLGAEIIL